MNTASSDETGSNKVVRQKSISMEEIAQVLNLHRTSILRRSEREKWAFGEETLRGGTRKRFMVDKLPSDVRRKVLIAWGDLPPELDGCVPLDFDKSKIAACARDFDSAAEWQRGLARQRLEVLERLDAFRAEFIGTRSEAVRRFAEIYNAREVDGIDPGIYAGIPKMSRSRLYEWEARFEAEGIAGLISRHGSGTKGASKLPLEQQNFVLATLATNPSLRAAKIHAGLSARYGRQAAHTRAVRDFLMRKRASDPQLFQHLHNPDAAKGKYQLALGSASEKAEHFLHYIEVDSTPADVLCSDGKRYTVIGGIDVFSRKTKFVVTKTSNSWGIAALMREIATDWGIPEHVVRDNGQDYASRMVNDGLLALGVKVVAVPPFTPEGKPHIERAFRTMSHDLLEALPGYIGHNVAERKAIENRRTFAERISKSEGKNRTAATDRPTGYHEVGLSWQELQSEINHWTEEIYHQRRHSGIGMSPNAKASQVRMRSRKITDNRALDILLAPSGERTIGKKGLRYENGLFWDNELIPYIGRKVTVRYDVRDASRVFCFDPDTRRFICEALDMALSGITVADKIIAKKLARRHLNERVKAIKTLAETVPDPIAAAISEMREERATIVNLPVSDAVTDNPFVDGAMAAIEARDRAEEIEEAQILADTEKALAKYRMVPEPNPKVLELVRPEQQKLDRMRFGSPIDRFESLRLNSSQRELTEEEYDWMEKSVRQWFLYADTAWDEWPPEDQKWFWDHAPAYFLQYSSKERPTEFGAES